jgi:hypothetical protein
MREKASFDYICIDIDMCVCACVCVCRYHAERVVRLHNDFPTTMREKSSFDAEAAAKSAAMQKMVFFFYAEAAVLGVGEMFWAITKMAADMAAHILKKVASTPTVGVVSPI